MDDHFLHQLRREPPAGFAIRLKWQLDRPVPPRPSRARLLLVFAIFGTAFALVSPPARRLFGDVFERTADTARAPTGANAPRQAAPAAASGVSGDTRSPALISLSRTGSAVPKSPGPQTPPAQTSDDPQPARPDDQPVVAASPGSAAINVPNVPPQSPQQRAQASVLTRQALFRLLSFVTRPLDSMLQGRAPVDLQLARTSAYRLNELSSMIPEVFRADTRTFDVKTRALDQIWTQPEDFAAKVEAMSLAEDALSGAIADHDTAATLMAIDRLEMACAACHDTYRKN